MLWLESEQVTGHPCLFSMLQFLSLVYLDHLLSAFAGPGSHSGDGGWEQLILELSACCRGAKVPECQLAQQWQDVSPLSSFSLVPLLCRRNHWWLVPYISDFIICLAGDYPVHSDPVLFDCVKHNEIVCYEWWFLFWFIWSSHHWNQKNCRIITACQWGAFGWKGKLNLNWSKYEKKKTYVDHVTRKSRFSIVFKIYLFIWSSRTWIFFKCITSVSSWGWSSPWGHSMALNSNHLVQQEETVFFLRSRRPELQAGWHYTWSFPMVLSGDDASDGREKETISTSCRNGYCIFSKSIIMLMV